MRYLFITGWQRSGTTLLARALNANPDITVVSDPALHFFKMTRNKFYNDYLGIKVDKKAPMDDDFLKSPDVKQLFHRHLDKLYFTEKEIEELKDKIKDFNNSWTEQHSPLIIPFLDDLKEGNVESVFKQLMNIIKKAYGSKKTKIVGLKELYCEQYIDVFTKRFDIDIKSIIMIRDPRAAYASRNTGKYLKRAGAKYSALFIARNWRKSVGYHLKYKNSRDYQGILYEDFVKNPDENLQRLCEFLEINYSKRMLNFNYYLNGEGKKWFSNSSYEKKDKISTESIDKWQDKLDTITVQAIESLCEKEMKKIGYSLIYKNVNKLKVLVEYRKKEKREKIRGWQKDYDYLLTDENIKEELTRDYLLNTKQHIKDNELLNRFFIFTDIYRKIRELL